MPNLIYGERVIDYQIHANSMLRSKVRIHVHPDGMVEVETPTEKPFQEIHAAVLKRARWIVEKLDHFALLKRYASPREYVSGETHFYLGRRYQLKIIEQRGTPSTVKIKGRYIMIELPYKDTVAVKNRLEQWYHKRAKEYLQKRLDSIVKDIAWLQTVPPLKLVAMNKQWGSCSTQGQINLNPWLVKAARECIDYVIIHELCHLREHNHSNKFYSLMDQLIPDWRKTKTKLDNMAELLLAE